MSGYTVPASVESRLRAAANEDAEAKHAPLLWEAANAIRDLRRSQKATRMALQAYADLMKVARKDDPRFHNLDRRGA